MLLKKREIRYINIGIVNLMKIKKINRYLYVIYVHSTYIPSFIIGHCVGHVKNRAFKVRRQSSQSWKWAEW